MMGVGCVKWVGCSVGRGRMWLDGVGLVRLGRIK